jgi:phosphonate transport system permease protein
MKIVASILDAILGIIVASLITEIIVPDLLDIDLPMWVTPVLWATWIGISQRKNTSIGELFLGLAPKHTPNPVRAHMGWIAFSVAIVSGWIITEIAPLEFFSADGLQGAGRIFRDLFSPELGVAGEALNLMVETIFTALMATVVAVPLSFLLSFPAARNVMSDTPTKKSVYLALRALLNIMRSMEPIIWAIIFSVWVGLGPFAGMLALVVHTVASLTKQYSEQIEDVDEGPIEAISATGATKLQVLWFAIVPQCVIPFLSFTIYRWDINVRMATIIGFVGGGGIGSKLIQYQNKGDYNEVGTYVILITLVVWILDVISARVREALR